MEERDHATSDDAEDGGDDHDGHREDAILVGRLAPRDEPPVAPVFCLKRKHGEHEGPDERSDRTEEKLHLDDSNANWSYGDHMQEPEELVTVATFADLPQAELCKQRLVAEHIDAFVLHGNTASIMPFLTPGEGGIHVQVKAKDAAAAKEILGS